MAKIPATIVTGFLGSGKTTLIRHLMAQAHGRRIALVVNEFGDLGIDGDTLRDCCGPGDLVELSNGCICCTVADEFLPVMQTLLDRPDPPEHIVIETSGLALPQPLIRAFAWPGVAQKVTVDGVVTVVDAAALAEGRYEMDATGHEDRPVAELFEDQIACADLILLNKADLVPDADALAASLAPRDGVRVLVTRDAALPIDVALGMAAEAEADMGPRTAPHHEAGGEEEHDHDEFDSITVAVAEIDSPESFAERLTAAIRAHGILRAKGFLAVRGKPMRLAVQAAGPRVSWSYDRPAATRPTTTRDGRLVVIGEAGLDAAAIRAALA